VGVWSSNKLKEKLDYMHGNPVQRKLVNHTKDWPWSSWLHYAQAEQGLIRIESLDDGSSGQPPLRRNVKNRTLEKHKGAAPPS